MIPKILFLYWHDDKYPEIVRYNIEKIKKLHPDYKFYLLNRKNVKKFVNIEKYKFTDTLLNTHAYFSDILRFFLLEKYGGIWIDASLIFWKNVNNIVKSYDKLVLIRNYNNDNGLNNKGYESWFIASIPSHPFIRKIKKIVVSLNTYDKIKHFLKNRNFMIQKNVHEEYHLIYHIISYVQQKHPSSLKNYREIDANQFYPNVYISNFMDIPFTNRNSFGINFSPIFYYLAAIKVNNYIKNGEPKHIIATKLTSELRSFVNYEHEHKLIKITFLVLVFIFVLILLMNYKYSLINKNLNVF